MKKLFIVACCGLLFSCKNENTKGKFTVTGEIKNIPDQKIYLEELKISNEPPVIIDTAETEKGKVTLTGIAPEQGLYRIRYSKDAGYIFINDIDKITFTVDAKNDDFLLQTFNSPANSSLKKFLGTIDSLQNKLRVINDGLIALHGANAKDSVIKIAENNVQQTNANYSDFILKYIDTTASPVIAMVALGYTQTLERDAVNKTVTALAGRFASHQQLARLLADYKQAMAKNNPATQGTATGSIAPDFTMPDVNGNPISLSSFKGKYVLVDFWASWCGPCRQENPNVVAAYKKFKDKNFTVLGVSLDKEKGAWLKAIKDDGLEWTHISDLKFWNSAAVPLYNIESIPFNVLVDPQGKIIAGSLRGSDLENKLAEVLK